MGDFEGTLNTAERTKSGYQLFYGIGDALRIRGDRSRARKLAADMRDRKLAALFLECARFTLWPRREEVGVIQATLCDDAYLDATRGKFAEADEVIQKNRRTAVLMSPLSRSANTKWTLPERSVYCVTDQIRKTWLSAWTSLPQ